MMKYIYFFVEGTTDNLFITKLFIEKLSLFGDQCNIIEYAVKKDKKIDSYINSINSIPNADYIFISDQDGKKDKKKERLLQYPSLNPNKLFISIYEIESWIIAGVSDRIVKKYKLKPIVSDTSSITKEIFNSMVPSKIDRLEFISYILDDYNVQRAMELNQSFKCFYEYLLKKAS